MADLNRNVKNLASGTLASAITSSDTSISLDCGTGSASTLTGIWPAVPFYMTIMPETPTAGVANSLDSEIVKVTAKTSDGSTVTLTVTRGQKNTTAKSFSSGAIATNGVYTGFNSFTATTSSTAGSSVMNYVISSDTLSSTPSEGDTIMVKFPLDANQLATLKVNDGAAANIILRSLGGGAESNSYRQYGSGAGAVYEKLLSADKWYSLVYTNLGNNSYGWVMLNSFLPITIDDIDINSFGITPDYSATQTDIGNLSSAYTIQNPCYLRVQFNAYGSSSSGYISLVINGQEAQRVYASGYENGYFVAQLSEIIPVSAGDQIQVTVTSNLTWGSARKAYIIPAKGNGWPNYNSEEF